MRNASDLPSDDHSTSAGVSVRRVICVGAASPSMNRTQICVPLGSPFARYAIRDPSGDQTAFEPSTRWRLREPSAFMIQRDDSHRSFSLSTHRRV
jgi:hypothetical protein